MANENFKWGKPSVSIPIEITVSALRSLVTAETLVPGQCYLITNPVDTGTIQVVAETNNRLSRKGTWLKPYNFKAFGWIRLEGENSSSTLDTLTVGGVSCISSAVTLDQNMSGNLAAIRNNINANGSSPVGAWTNFDSLILISKLDGEGGNSLVVAGSTTGDITIIETEDLSEGLPIGTAEIEVVYALEIDKVIEARDKNGNKWFYDYSAMVVEADNPDGVISEFPFGHPKYVQNTIDNSYVYRNIGKGEYVMKGIEIGRECTFYENVGHFEKIKMYPNSNFTQNFCPGPDKVDKITLSSHTSFYENYVASDGGGITRLNILGSGSSFNDNFCTNSGLISGVNIVSSQAGIAGCRISTDQNSGLQEVTVGQNCAILDLEVPIGTYGLNNVVLTGPGVVLQLPSTLLNSSFLSFINIEWNIDGFTIKGSFSFNGAANKGQLGSVCYLGWIPQSMYPVYFELDSDGTVTGGSATFKVGIESEDDDALLTSTAVSSLVAGTVLHGTVNQNITVGSRKIILTPEVANITGGNIYFVMKFRKAAF